MFGRATGCAAAVTVIVGAALVGASAQDQPIFRAGVRTVPVYTTVIDSSGRLVPNLEKEDFTLLDNGKPVQVTLFSNESQPFTAVVMLDTSASMTSNLKFLNRAAEQFLLRLLPVDKAQVGAFNDKISPWFCSGTMASWPQRPMPSPRQQRAHTHTLPITCQQPPLSPTSTTVISRDIPPPAALPEPPPPLQFTDSTSAAQVKAPGTPSSIFTSPARLG